MKILLSVIFLAISFASYSKVTFYDSVPESIKVYSIQMLKEKCPKAFDDKSIVKLVSYSKDRAAVEEEVIYTLSFKATIDHGKSESTLDLRLINEDVFHSPSLLSFLSFDERSKTPICN